MFKYFENNCLLIYSSSLETATLSENNNNTNIGKQGRVDKV